ncbi:MAG: LPS export ABC transporter permease LptF [Magnetococcales bacterium]|nr:LPS export ABC transporter permease LptF [Magnetococcales bacterium]
MNRLSRYLFVECALSLLAALLILTFLAMLPRVLQLVDLWVNKGVSIGVLGHMTLLLIPQFIVAALPMAVLTGILLALGRLSQDSEMVIMKACGISLYQMLRPISLLVGFCALGALFFETIWVPHAFHQFHQLRLAVLSSTTLTLKPQTFSHVVPGLTIYIDTQNQAARTMGGILIYDQRQADAPVTLIASSGRLHTLDNGNAALFLTDGSRHERKSDGRYRQLKFATYDLEMGVSFGLGDEGREKGLEELNGADLEKMIQTGGEEVAYLARLEWHRRWAFPMATLILGVLALPLGLQQSHRSGRSYGLVVAILTLIVHIFLLSLGEAMAKKGLVPPLAGYALPTLIMAGFTLYILINTARGRPFKLAVILVHTMASLPLKLLRPGSAIGRKS